MPCATGSHEPATQNKLKPFDHPHYFDLICVFFSFLAIIVTLFESDYKNFCVPKRVWSTSKAAFLFCHRRNSSSNTLFGTHTNCKNNLKKKTFVLIGIPLRINIQLHKSHKQYVVSDRNSIYEETEKKKHCHSEEN